MESLHRALFEAAADAILVVDEGGSIVLANAASGALFGCDPAELVGALLESLVPARFEEHVRQRSDYLRDPGPRAMGGGLALFARRLDGSEVPVDISLSPLVVGGRRLVSCSIRDLRGRTHGLDHLRVQARPCAPRPTAS